MSRWLRHYAGMCRDEKLVRVAMKSRQTVERVVWVWSAILESAAEINDGGKYELDEAEVAYFLRADEADILAIVAGLVGAGRLADSVVVKWCDRQFVSDTSADRQRRYRERKAHVVSVANVSDVIVTSPSRHSDALETKTDTDTDTDTESSLRSDNARGREIEFEREFWPAWPNKVGKPDALRSFLRARKAHSLEAIIDGLARYVREKPPDRPWLNPATFLNQERFNDAPAASFASARGQPPPQFQRPPSTRSIALKILRPDIFDAPPNDPAPFLELPGTPLAARR